MASRSASEHWRRDEIARKRLAWLAITLALLGLVVYPFIESVKEGFVVLALILFAGALILPAVIQFFIRVVLRATPEAKWKTRWCISDAVAQLPQLRIALMALLLTLTANIGVTTLVSSFRIALSDWLEVRLSANYYVRSDSLDVQQLLNSAQQDTPAWFVASHERSNAQIRWHGRPSQIQGLDLTAPDSQDLLLAATSADGFQRWREIKGEIQPIIANEQVRYLAGVELGDIITLPTADDKNVEFEVVAFQHDYGSPYFHFYLPSQTVKEYWPNASAQGLFLWTIDDSHEYIEQALLAAGARQGEWVGQDDIKRVSLYIFDRTFAITAALNGLTLIVAGIALLAALMAVHQQRLPEYAHWRSLGLKHSEWFLIVAVPLLLMVLITGLLSLPLGWLLSWMLIHKLNVIAFGWTMPLVWSWQPVLQLSLVTLVVVCFTLLFATLRVRRTLPTAIKQMAGQL